MTDADETLIWAWLCCGKRPPVPLGPKPTISIGRGKDCDLVLRDASVSRLQAVVKVDAQSGLIRFIDGTSSNGSLVNGEAVDSALLEPGDVLTFGRFDVKVREVLAWLVSGALPPVPLGDKPEVFIGRSKECDLSIRDPGISRRQGTIRIVGNTLEYEDGGGSNGSYVNGERVDGVVPMQPGDVLTFGPYEAVLRSNDDMHSLSDTLDHDGTIPIAQIETGLLGETPLRETLQEFGFRAKSGNLKIIAGRDTGYIVLQKGKLVRAAFKSATGEDAVLAMLALEEGRYSFAPGADDGVASMTSTVTRLLLEDSRRRDEASS